MKLNKKMSKMIAELEFLIGSECYNPNSYDGWNDIEGCDFRYPINLPDKEGNYKKIRMNLNESALISPEDITPEAVTFMKYRFGSNELYIVPSTPYIARRTECIPLYAFSVLVPIPILISRIRDCSL